MLGKFGRKPADELNTTLNRGLCARGNNAVKTRILTSSAPNRSRSRAMPCQASS